MAINDGGKDTKLNGLGAAVEDKKKHYRAGLERKDTDS